MNRLSNATLASATNVLFPQYDRAKASNGIVHLGLGAFPRAHMALYTEEALNTGDLRWGIIGASLRRPDVAEQLNPQDGLYTLLERDGAGTRARIIGAVSKVITAPQNPAALLAAMADPACHIVTLTITEKGYCLDPATGELDEQNPAMAADLLDLTAPKTAPGFIVAALAMRKAAGVSGFTALSCDNLPSNGSRLKGAVLELARKHDASLADWIDDNVGFPATMVDRIVPATTAVEILEGQALSGLEDQGLVVGEPFRQWVIEDDFRGARPMWENTGAIFTKDVHQWELTKLRMLNGAHSTLAYLGALAGHDYVHQAVAAPGFLPLVRKLHRQTAATFEAPQGLDVAHYSAELIGRFVNPSLAHKTRQIAMDGSQKLPQRLLMPISDGLKMGLDVSTLILGVAAWIRWQGGKDESNMGYIVDDPMAAQTRQLWDGNPSVAEKIAAFMGLKAVFGDLSDNATLKDGLTKSLNALLTQGAAEVVRGFTN